MVLALSLGFLVSVSPFAKWTSTYLQEAASSTDPCKPYCPVLLMAEGERRKHQPASVVVDPLVWRPRLILRRPMCWKVHVRNVGVQPVVHLQVVNFGHLDITLWHETITRITPWELSFVAFFSLGKKDFQEITRESHNFCQHSNILDFFISIMFVSVRWSDYACLLEIEHASFHTQICPGDYRLFNSTGSKRTQVRTLPTGDTLKERKQTHTHTH